MSENPREDVEWAWRVAQSAKAAPSQSHLAMYLLHWLMGSLYQYRDGDFTHSVDEAKAAVAMAPYETEARAGLSYRLANAGDVGEAIAWMERAAGHDPSRLTGFMPPSPGIIMSASDTTTP